MSQFLNKCYANLEAYVPGEQPRDMQYIKLNTNESPYPPAPGVCKALDTTIIENLRLYSDPTCRNLKEKLAALYGVKVENIYLTNGSDDALNFAFMAFGEKGAAFPDITYGFYPVFGELHGISCREIPLAGDFSLNPSDYHSASALVVIANPNAPTGKSIPVAEIRGILETNRDHVVVIDEAYVDFGGESACPLIREFDNLLVVRTFSKSRCMAGGRLGYAFGCPALIADLEKLKYATNPYNVNRLTLLLGEKTVEAEGYYQEKCGEIIRVREKTALALKEMGFEVLPSRANFLFIRHPSVSGEKLYRELKNRAILVRHFSKARIREYNRVTIGTDDQMRSFLAAVKEILEGTP
jgi:histidinol-phosphate aminotransferase